MSKKTKHKTTFSIPVSQMHEDFAAWLTEHYGYEVDVKSVALARLHYAKFNNQPERVKARNLAARRRAEADAERALARLREFETDDEAESKSATVLPFPDSLGQRSNPASTFVVESGDQFIDPEDDEF